MSSSVSGIVIGSNVLVTGDACVKSTGVEAAEERAEALPEAGALVDRDAALLTSMPTTVRLPLKSDAQDAGTIVWPDFGFRESVRECSVMVGATTASRQQDESRSTVSCLVLHPRSAGNDSRQVRRRRGSEVGIGINDVGRSKIMSLLIPSLFKNIF